MVLSMSLLVGVEVEPLMGLLVGMEMVMLIGLWVA